MFTLGEESACNVVVSIGGCCHRSGINHRDEIIERFGRCRAEFARNGAAPGRLHVVHRGELSGRNFRVEPCMIASDMPNTNNANAQLFHWSPNAVNSESFRGSTLETLRGRLGHVANKTHDVGRQKSLSAVSEKPFVSLRDAFSQRDRRLPAELANFGDVQEAFAACRLASFCPKRVCRRSRPLRRLTQPAREW